MIEEIQRITDRLAVELSRAVFVEDAWFRPLTNSAQFGSIDKPRIQALLWRAPTAEHMKYFRNCGVTDSTEPLRVPGNTALDLLPRVVVPVQAGGQTLARIWLIDDGPPISDGEIAHALRIGREMRTSLLERRAAIRQDVATASTVVNEIEHAGEQRRWLLFEQLRDDFGMRNLDQVRACVVQTDATAPIGDCSVDDIAPILCNALEEFIEHLGADGAVGTVWGDKIIALVPSTCTNASSIEPIAIAAHEAAAHHDIMVMAMGLGGILHDPDGYNRSVRQAQFSSRVAAKLPHLDRQACWDNLGEYRLFYAFEWSKAGVAALDPNVASLIEERRAPLAETLLTYLDRDGDVEATATALNVHRTTLYYRIDRAKNVLGQELTGPARLRIHAALRLAQLSGLICPLP